MSRHHLDHIDGSCIVLMRGPLGVASLKSYGSFWQITGYGDERAGQRVERRLTKRQALRAALVFARDFYERAALIPSERA